MRFTLVTSVVALAVVATAVPQSDEQRVGVTVIPVFKRSGLVNADNSVNFGALNSHIASVQAKILRGFDNFEKHTGKVHPSVGKGVGKRGSGDNLTDDNEELWYGTISAGTPAKSFTVDFDTGSSDLFLPGTRCSSCGHHTTFDPSSSSTSKDVGQTFHLPYADGSSVSGEQFTDTVSIAGYTATGQTLGVADTYSSSFQSRPSDGLMGMAFESISGYHAAPVFQSLVSQGKVDPVFSFKLSDSGAELYIGGTNSALYEGDFAYVPVTTQGYWQVNMDSVQGNGRSLLSNVDSIIDTGTTLIIGTPSQVSSLYSALGGKAVSSDGGSGFYTFPCNSFPDIGFTFGGKSFSISASTLNIGQLSPGSSDCVSGLTGQNVGSSFWVIGDVFLRNVYTAFDLGQTRVGFAELR